MTVRDLGYEYCAPKITFSDKTFTPLNVVKQRVIIEVTEEIFRVRTFMHFVNKQSQTLEGELQFYLPAEATVTKVFIIPCFFFRCSKMKLICVTFFFEKHSNS